MLTSSPLTKGSKSCSDYEARGRFLCTSNPMSAELCTKGRIPKSADKQRRPKPHLLMQGDRFIPNRAATDYSSGFAMIAQTSEGNRTPNSWKFNADPFTFGEALSANALPDKSHLGTPRTPRMLSFGGANAKLASSPFLDPGDIVAENLRARTPKRTRKIREDPLRVLTAPDVTDNPLFTPIAWSKQNILSVGLDDMLFFTEAAPDTLDAYQKNPGVTEVLDISDLFRIIRVLEWDENGDKLAVGNLATIELVDACTQKKLTQVRTAEAKSLSLAWRGSLLACGDEKGKLYMKDIRTNIASVVDQTINSKSVCKLCWNEDGVRFASGGGDGSLRYWDIRSISNPVQNVEAHNGAIKALAWCPWDGHLLASGGLGTDKCMKIWDMRNGTLEDKKATDGPIVSLCWNAEFKEIATALSRPSNVIRLWSHRDSNSIGKLTNHLDHIICMVQSGDGTSVASVGMDEVLCVWRCWPKRPKKNSVEVRSPLAPTLR